MAFNIYKNILFNKVNEITNNTDNTSICSQLELPSSQSIVSQLGFKTENAINEFINTQNNTVNLKVKHSIISNHQIDVLFQYKNKIYYFECKNNMNMDTEKSLKSIEKIKNVETFLRKTYPGKKITCKFLNMWKHSADDITNLKNCIHKKDIFGYFSFFKIFGIQVSKRDFSQLFRNVKSQLNPGQNIENKEINNHISNYKHISLQRRHTLLKRKYDHFVSGTAPTIYTTC